MPDYTYVDQSPALQYLFYPRQECSGNPSGSYDYYVEVEKDIKLACRFYPADPAWPWLLYFHGNGEIASDYDEIAPFYQICRLNLVVADYRGYGLSQGRPTVSSVASDAEKVFKAVKQEVLRRYEVSDWWVMGRSMGSIAALQLAWQSPAELKGFIIESGFASVTRLITHLGIMAPNAALKSIEEACFNMIAGIKIPGLILHGDRDTVVPWSEGKLIYDALGSIDKQMLTIPGASHNDIICCDMPRYFGAIQGFIYQPR
jgi:hypothetical protein